MRFFQLRDDVNIVGRWHLGEVRHGEQEPRLSAGIPFSGSLSTTVTHRGKPIDFCLTSFAVPVVVPHLGEAIASVASTDVERLPLEIDGQSGFEVLNVVRIVDCLDESRSEYMKWTERDHRADLAGQYRMVTRLHIDPARIPPDARVFRLKGWLVGCIVAEPVKEAMERAGCKGAKFVEVT